MAEGGDRASVENVKELALIGLNAIIYDMDKSYLRGQER